MKKKKKSKMKFIVSANISAVRIFLFVAGFFILKIGKKVYENIKAIPSGEKLLFNREICNR